MNSAPKRLDEINLIRVILILLLLLHHSFVIFTGKWAPPIELVEIPIYGFISDMAYSLMLETFVFISGFLFAFQQLYLGKSYTLKQLIKKKSVRLLIPMYIWGAIYMVLFREGGSPGGVIHMV